MGAIAPFEQESHNAAKTRLNELSGTGWWQIRKKAFAQEKGQR